MKNGMLYVIITAICFTIFEPISKILTNAGMNPYAITAIRFFIGALFLLPFSIRGIIKNKVKLNLKDYLLLTGLGVLVICLSMVLLQYAVKIADSPTLIAVIFSSNSIITIALSAIFLKAKLNRTKIIGIILCVIGVLVSSDFTGGSNLISVALALLSAISFSSYTILCKKYMTKVSGIIQSGISFFLGSLVLIIGLLIFKIDLFEGLSLSVLPELFMVSAVVTGIGYWAFFEAIRTGGPQIAAMAFLIKPILAPFATLLINKIMPNPSIIISLILVVIGAFLCSGVIKEK